MEQLRSTLLVLLCGTALQVFSTETCRIYKGHEARPNSFPYHVLLLVLKNAIETPSSGSIITNNFVLTSASSIVSADQVIILFEKHGLYVNDPNKLRMVASKIIVHENYSGENLENNIGLLELPRRLMFGPTIQRIKLPHTSQINNHFIGRDGLVTGWGTTGDEYQLSPHLKQLEVKILGPNDCYKHYKYRHWEDLICAVGINNGNICPGDSGDPLVIQKSDRSLVQIGIASFGSETGCTNDVPHAYTRVLAYIDWILQHSDYTY